MRTNSDLHSACMFVALSVSPTLRKVFALVVTVGKVLTGNIEIGIVQTTPTDGLAGQRGATHDGTQHNEARQERRHGK